MPCLYRYCCWRLLLTIDIYENAIVQQRISDFPSCCWSEVYFRALHELDCISGKFLFFWVSFSSMSNVCIIAMFWQANVQVVFNVEYVMQGASGRKQRHYDFCNTQTYNRGKRNAGDASPLRWRAVLCVCNLCTSHWWRPLYLVWRSRVRGHGPRPNMRNLRLYEQDVKGQRYLWLYIYSCNICGCCDNINNLYRIYMLGIVWFWFFHWWSFFLRNTLSYLCV